MTASKRLAQTRIRRRLSFDVLTTDSSLETINVGTFLPRTWARHYQSVRRSESKKDRTTYLSEAIPTWRWSIRVLWICRHCFDRNQRTRPRKTVPRISVPPACSLDCNSGRPLYDSEISSTRCRPISLLFHLTLCWAANQADTRYCFPVTHNYSEIALEEVPSRIRPATSTASEKRSKESFMYQRWNIRVNFAR